jgi:hypothetical protein
MLFQEIFATLCFVGASVIVFFRRVGFSTLDVYFSFFSFRNSGADLLNF